MSETHCIQFRPLSPVIVLRRDFLDICEANSCAALILSQMMYWHEVKVSHRAQARITNDQQVAAGEAATQDVSVWVWKTRQDLQVELMKTHGLNAIGSALAYLVEKSYLHERPNPRNTWDRTKQYRFDVAAVQAAINGLALLPAAPDTDDETPTPPVPPRSRAKSGAGNEALKLTHGVNGSEDSPSKAPFEALKLTTQCFDSISIDALNPTHRDDVFNTSITETPAETTYIKTTTETRVPSAVPAPEAAVAVLSGNYSDKVEEETSLILRLEDLGINTDSADKLIQQFSSDLLDEVISSAKTRRLIRAARDSAAYARWACKEHATEQAKREANRKVVRAPRPEAPVAASGPGAPVASNPPAQAPKTESFDPAAAYAALSESDRTALDEAAWARAMADAPAPIRARLEAAAKSQMPPTHMVRDLLLMARNALLVEREERRKRQIGLDFG